MLGPVKKFDYTESVASLEAIEEREQTEVRRWGLFTRVWHRLKGVRYLGWSDGALRVVECAGDDLSVPSDGGWFPVDENNEILIV